MTKKQEATTVEESADQAAMDQLRADLELREQSIAALEESIGQLHAERGNLIARAEQAGKDAAEALRTADALFMTIGKARGRLSGDLAIDIGPEECPVERCLAELERARALDFNVEAPAISIEAHLRHALRGTVADWRDDAPIDDDEATRYDIRRRFGIADQPEAFWTSVVPTIRDLRQYLMGRLRRSLQAFEGANLGGVEVASPSPAGAAALAGPALAGVGAGAFIPATPIPPERLRTALDYARSHCISGCAMVEDALAGRPIEPAELEKHLRQYDIEIPEHAQVLRAAIAAAPRLQP